MNIKVKFTVSTFILCYALLAFHNSHAAVQHGPVFDLAYFPLGYGRMNIPYSSTIAGSANTVPGEGSTWTSARKYLLSAGYFYDFLQADISYESTTIMNQVFSKSSIGDDIPKTERDVYMLRGGKRFSHPGDSTYHFIYLGFKRMSSCSEYENIELTAYGYFAGYEGFYTFGRKYPVEFVTKINAFIGTYRKEKFESDFQFEYLNKKNSITAKIDIGIGFLYEPNDIAMLVKLSNDYDRIKYRSYLNDSSLEFSFTTLSSYIGFEIIYNIPNIKYNKINQDK